jgi:HD-GYP domain-containing protein (c-di-GMP phosphodiesterase class II)
MTATTPKLPDDLPDGNPHYIQAVTELGEEQEVQAQEDIYASNGMKLVAKGTRVNRELYDRLVKHKLRAPLDLQLAAEHQLDATALAAAAGQLFEEDNLLQRLANRAGGTLDIKHGFSRVKLMAPLNFRLTVMRSRRADLFRHSLRCGLIAHALAIRLQLSAADQSAILLTAICHDLGEMHTDPALLAAGRQVTPEERRYIHVHPITSYVLMRDLTTPVADSMSAVLQHHERMDGSGYPYGLHNERITRLGRLMAVVEVVETVLRRFDPQRLDIMLKLNHARFDPEVLNALRDLLRSEFQLGNGAVQNNSEPLLHFERIREALHTWETFRDFFEGQSAEKSEEKQALAFLFERMREFRSLTLQAGIDINDFESTLNMISEDPDLLNEMQTTSTELTWRMNEIANEIELKAPKLSDLSKITLSNFVESLRSPAEQKAD